jgi:hypothetical protein
MSLVYYLHSEFCRYYWSYIDSFPCSPEQHDELRQNLLDIVGWIPDELIEAMAADLRKVANEAEDLTKGHEGSQADELRNIAKMAHVLGERQVVKYREMCRTFLSRNTK